MTRIDKPKEWWLKRADLEGDCEVGAGTLAGAPAPIGMHELEEIKQREYEKGYDRAVCEIRDWLAGLLDKFDENWAPPKKGRP